MSQKKRLLLPCAALALAALMIPATLGTVSTARAQEPAVAAKPGPQWEYRALRIPDRQQAGSRERDLRARRSSSEETLNQLGAEGWELVTVRVDTADPVFYFKRLKR